MTNNEKYERDWLVVYLPTPMKNMKVSWDDDIPNIWKKHEKTNVSKHQPEISKDL
jgi:hypothetical protein